jgi:hypothetical protein
MLNHAFLFGIFNFRGEMEKTNMATNLSPENEM